MVDALSAMNAYRNQMKMMQGVNDKPPTDDAQGNQPAFAKMVQDVIGNAIGDQHKAEGLEMQSMTGKVELSDLVTAVASAELSLNTVVAVRDKVINAYQDIIRMPL
jgi:flagellar hook-basal body complex protein FliE